MASADTNTITDAAELQNVLTRYSDSYYGYVQAAEVVESASLATAFLEIAERRKHIVDQVSLLIVREGETPDTDGSPEGAIHRWWIRVRAQMTDEEFRATLEECVRGEKELARTVTNALEHGIHDSHHAAILADISSELKEALQCFEIALGRC